MKSAFTLLAGSILLGLSVPASVPATGENPHILPAGEDSLRSYCEKVEQDRRRIFYLRTRKARMSLQVKGIYTREENIFFLLLLTNHSHLDYDIDSIRFLEADKWGRVPLRPTIRTPVKVLRAVYTYGNTKLIRGKSQELSVVALPRFTLPEGKRLVIEVLERNGGRNLRLFADNFTLVRARLI